MGFHKWKQYQFYGTSDPKNIKINDTTLLYPLRSCLQTSIAKGVTECHINRQNHLHYLAVNLLKNSTKDFTTSYIYFTCLIVCNLSSPIIERWKYFLITYVNIMKICFMNRLNILNKLKKVSYCKYA